MIKKILIIFGTRPEAIKIAPLIKEFSNYKDSFETKVCVTGQHRKMLDQVLEVFNIIPNYDLNIMKDNQDLSEVTARILLGLKEVFNDFKPNLVIVHGDTSTTFAASLAAFHQKIEVAHVEAGLRTNNLLDPWPEEANRRLTSVIAKYHFAPTEINKKNLIKEGINENAILVTGNTVIDAVNLTLNKIKGNKNLVNKIEKNIYNSGVDCINSKFIVITCHRRENYEKGIKNICDALKIISEKYKNINFIFSVHPNPSVFNPVMDYLSKIDNIKLIKPVEYEEFIYLMSKSHLILTDSGGIQEEATSLGKPVLVMRNFTERPEAIESGIATLVGNASESIIKSVEKVLQNENQDNEINKTSRPYGDGEASKKIIEFIL